MFKLAENKELTEHKPIEQLKASAKLFIPLSQHLGKICNSEVKEGDRVLLGQRIASVDAHVSSFVHSSVSGIVSTIGDYPHPVLGSCRAIVIDNDFKDEFYPGVSNYAKDKGLVDKLTKEEIISLIKNAGIVGMGGATFPTHIKLSPPKAVGILIINGAECEPYLTSDSRLMIEKTKEILYGIELVAKCLNVKDVYIAIEDNKPEAIEAFNNAILNTPYAVRILKSQYPQGGEKQLIKNVLGKVVPSGKLPFDIGVVVQNVATCFAVYEAIYKNKPLYERVVTATGSCLANPKNLLVRIGTPLKELIETCGPLKKEPAKIIVGGPMMGFSQFTDTVPVIKSTGGVVLLDKKEAKINEEQYCIRCGACVRECPMGLMPCLINLASEKSRWTEAKAHNAADCIECGLCNYVCPANRRLTQSIKRAKLELNR